MTKFFNTLKEAKEYAGKRKGRHIVKGIYPYAVNVKRRDKKSR